jgi:cyclic pyranopterin phosphate synthase
MARTKKAARKSAKKSVKKSAKKGVKKRVAKRTQTTTAALTHLDKKGAARMVDVSAKSATEREAIAEARIVMSQATLDLVIGAARIGGIMAAKHTHSLIPLCHPLPIAKVSIDIAPDWHLPGLIVTATVKVTGPTGVEMEALTAASIACLTIYDMVKAVERGMHIEGVRLLEKSGGKSGHYRAET